MKVALFVAFSRLVMLDNTTIEAAFTGGFAASPSQLGLQQQLRVSPRQRRRPATAVLTRVVERSGSYCAYGHNGVQESVVDSHQFCGIDAYSRRTAMKKTLMSALLVAHTIVVSNPAAAKGIKPDEAFQNLVKAREELELAKKSYVSKKDYNGLQTYLAEEAININKYEENAQALLESKRLDVESKKAIGTIRRYGVGADVMIMYGGLKAELDNVDHEDDDGSTIPNAAEVQKYLTRTMDSLDEVIAICRSNGF